jgi:hypothetical protein
VLAAGLSLPARAAVVPTAAASFDPGPTTAPVVDTDRELEARSSARTAGHVTRPLPLVPAPPPDRRDAPDPFVLADGDRYLLYSTQVGFHNVPVATSPYLSNWSPPADALPQLPAWAGWGRTWAPGVVRLGNQYLLYFAAHDSRSGRQCIGVAASKTAEGPFAATATEPLVCQTGLGGSIDPHPFVDDDGTAYLLWKADGNAIGLASTLFAQTLAPSVWRARCSPRPSLRTASRSPGKRPLCSPRAHRGRSRSSRTRRWSPRAGRTRCSTPGAGGSRAGTPSATPPAARPSAPAPR